MFRKYFLSTMIFICTFLLTLVPLSAQEEEGEIIIISERVGKEIDREERDKFKLFEESKGFQSAVFVKLPDNTYLLKITYLVEKTEELKVKRIKLSEESINKYRYHIDHFVKNQEDIYKNPGTAFYLEIGGKGFIYSTNIDFRLKKSTAIGFSISFYEWGNNILYSSYYYLLGKKYSKLEIGGAIGYSTGYDEVRYNGSLGYRYQKKKGVLFRATVYFFPPYSDVGPLWWLGISLGYSL